MPNRWNPGGNCCSPRPRCDPAYLTLSDATTLDSRWTYTGTGVPTVIGTDHVSVLAFSGVTTLSHTHINGRYNEAFSIKFDVKTGNNTGSNETVTVNAGSDSIVFDLKAHTAQINARPARNIGETPSAKDNWLTVYCIFTPDWIGFQCQRFSDEGGDETYEYDWFDSDGGFTATVQDADSSAASDYTSDGWTIDFESYIEIRNVVYKPKDVVWTAGQSNPDLYCGCVLEWWGYPAYSMFTLWDQMSKLDATITGQDIPQGGRFAPADYIARGWGPTNGAMLPGNYGDGFSQSDYWIGGSRGWVLANQVPFLYVHNRSAWRLPLGSQACSLAFLLSTSINCVGVTQSVPYPQPQQRLTLIVKKVTSALAGPAIQQCQAETTTQSAGRDLENVFDSFSIAATIAANQGTDAPLGGAICSGGGTWPEASTYVNGATTVTIDWPGT